MTVRTVLERGPKGKRAVAFALDWPGWDRGAKTSELALELLETYRARYRPVADLAGLADAFAAGGQLQVVEDRVGNTSTDFFGVAFSPAEAEREPMSADDLERRIRLLEACWAFFDGVVARVSPEMRKGPRGGGRDRDRIVEHTLLAESGNYAHQLGLRVRDADVLTPDGLGRYRADLADAIRAYHAGRAPKPMRTWTLQYLIHRSAYHVLDHAWEMEDKDLTATA